MNITINDQRIDFVLDGESSLGDVISSVEDYARANGSVIELIRVDGRPVPFDFGSPEFRKRVEDVGDLKIETSTKPALAVESLLTADEYAGGLLKRTGEELEPDRNDEILDAVALIAEAVSSSLRILGIRPALIPDGARGSLGDVLREAASFHATYERRYIDREGMKKLRGMLEALPSCLNRAVKRAAVKNPGALIPLSDRVTYARYLRDVLAEAASLSRRLESNFDSIARGLVTGEDGHALSALAFATEQLGEIFDLLRLAEGYADPHRLGDARALFGSITETLGELEAALKTGDMVSLGDSLGYVLKPLFSSFLDSFEKLYFSIDTGAIS